MDIGSVSRLGLRQAGRKGFRDHDKMFQILLGAEIGSFPLYDPKRPCVACARTATATWFAFLGSATLTVRRLHELSVAS